MKKKNSLAEIDMLIETFSRREGWAMLPYKAIYRKKIAQLQRLRKKTIDPTSSFKRDLVA